jgi:hypothetical protein
VKYDCVPKDTLVELQKDDSNTLRPGLLSEFEEQNNTDTIDFSAIKAISLCMRQQGKRGGSLVV